MRIRAIALFAVLGSAAMTATGEGLRLHGTFIQYQPWMLELDAEEWHAELDAMRRAGLDTLVIQWLEADSQRYFGSDTAVDPTAIILDYADAHGMCVFLGLSHVKKWFVWPKEGQFPDALVARNAAFAQQVWQHYGKRRAFAGWYIPQEIMLWGIPRVWLTLLTDYLQRVSTTCKEFSGGKPVAIAPYFDGKAPPETVGRDLARLLGDSGIDIVMLQDGVGARGWDDDVERVRPYFRACRDACLEMGAELWSDLECFRLVRADPATGRKQGFVPADAERIGRQLAAEAPFVERFVTFDFFHYMSPQRGPAQEKLFKDYLDTFVSRPFYPVHGISPQVSAGFAYYQDRSPASIASEMRANGFSTVRYMVSVPSDIQPELIDAFHREGMGVWWAVFLNAAYSVKGFPDGWESWKVVRRADLTGEPFMPAAKRFCLNNPGFRAWEKAQFAEVLETHPFDGVDILEPYWPAYPGPQSKRI